VSNLKWKRRLGQWWPFSKSSGKVILLYHALGNSAWAMPTKQFHDQLKWLTDHAKVVSLPTLIHSEYSDDLQVALTFDDGYQNLHDEAAPLLSDKKLNATVYLNTGWISDNLTHKQSVPTLGHYPEETFLTWQEVKNLYHAGWLIGSHGVNHHNFALTTQALTLQELSQSKKDIELHLQTPCEHFAYPFGRHSKIVKAIAKRVGYQYAAAARHGSLHPHSDLFSLPRINIEKNYSLKDFQHILQGKWDYLNLIHQFKGL